LEQMWILQSTWAGAPRFRRWQWKSFGVLFNGMWNAVAAIDAARGTPLRAAYFTPDTAPPRRPKASRRRGISADSEDVASAIVEHFERREPRNRSIRERGCEGAEGGPG